VISLRINYRNYVTSN